MPRKAKAKPKSPAQIAAEKLARRRQDFAAVNLQSDGADLAAHTDVAIRREGQKNVLTARRLDVFEALKAGMQPGCYDAARRLERDITIRRGEHDHGRPMERVDGDEQAALCRNDQIIAAGERVDAVLKRLSGRDAWLLTELISPQPSRPGWRETVAYITGESHLHAQGAAVRAACVNLRDAYEERSCIAA
jgi:hypothetical protein